MESRRERRIRSQIGQLEVDAKSAGGSSVLLAPEEQEQFGKVVARIDALRRLLAEGGIHAAD